MNRANGVLSDTCRFKAGHIIAPAFYRDCRPRVAAGCQHDFDSRAIDDWVERLDLVAEWKKVGAHF